MDIAIEGVKVLNYLSFQSAYSKIIWAGVIQYEEEIFEKPSHQLQELTK